MLKRISLLFIIFIISLLVQNEAKALSGNGFIWNKTEVSIPLNDNFESYLDEFEVKFYYKGQILDDVDVKVEIDDMYYNNFVVSTKEVGVKTVKLIATVLGYSSYDKKDVLVHVVDTKLPTITQVQSLIIPLGSAVNYNEYFLFRDNDEITSCIINDGSVNYTKIGVYPISIIVIDKSGNRVEQNYNVSIVDKGKPSLETASFIEVIFGDEDFDIRDYVKASDNLDGDITNNIEYFGLDVYKLGKQSVTIKVEDSNHNETVVTKEITVVDNVAPVIELTTYFKTISSFEKPDFKSFIKNITDKCDKSNLLEKVVIDDSDFEEEFGTYDIIYTVYDASGNKATRNLSLTITYNSAPIIEANDLVFKQNEKFNLKDYIKVTDEYDENINVTIDESILDKSTPGTYEIIITALNKAGIKSEKIIYVTIKSDRGESFSIISQLYDYIYENKLMFAILILGTTCTIFYFFFRKKEFKRGE